MGVLSIAANAADPMNGMEHMRAPLFFSSLFFAAASMAQNPGDLDSTFSEDGKLVLDTVVLGTGRTVAVNARPSGGLLVMVQSVISQLSHNRLFALLDDGTLDTTFGSAGLLDIADVDVEVQQVLDDSGFLLRISSTEEHRFVRYDANGSINPVYGDNGTLLLAIPDTVSIVFGMIIQPDGRILFCGRSGHDAILGRLLPTGELDATFGLNGIVRRFAYVEYYDAIAFSYTGVQAISDGTVVALRANNAYHTAMIFTSGYDTFNSEGGFLGSVTFSGGGGDSYYSRVIAANAEGTVCADVDGFFKHVVFRTMAGGIAQESIWSGDLPPLYAHATALGSDQTSNFLVAGTRDYQAGWRICRMSQGAADVSFGSGMGWVSTIFGTTTKPTSIAVQLNGKVVVAGYSSILGLVRPVLARYHNIPDPRAQLDLRVYLGGAFDSTTFLMRDDLRASGLLPTQQPYTAMGYVPVNSTGPWAM